MKNILFDLKATQPTSKNSAKFHGGGEYTKELFFEIIERIDSLDNFEVFYDSTLYIEDRLLDKVKEKNIKSHLISNINDIQSLIDNNSYHLFISFLPYKYYNINFNKTKTMFTLHGIRPLETPIDKYYLKFSSKPYDILKYILISLFKKRYINRQKDKFKKLLTIGDYILVPSLHTKYSLSSFFTDVDVDKLHILHSPITKISSTNMEFEKNFMNKNNLESKKYLMLISTDRWIKNSYRVILALNEIYKENKCNMKTVLVGGKHMLKYVENKNNIISLDYLKRDELEVLYKNSYSLIYPSLNEGFGYPPIEAMKYGTVVLTSAITSIPEVCLDNVIYFNPYDEKEIKNRILMVLNEKEVYATYESKGKSGYNSLIKVQELHIDKLLSFLNKV